VQSTVEAPAVKGEPDCRVQVTWAGGTPPVVVGAANVTLAGLVAAVSVTLAGHEIVNGATVAGGGVGGVGEVTGGGVGPVGDEQDETNAIASAPRIASSPVERRTRGFGSLTSIGSNRQYYYRITDDKIDGRTAVPSEANRSRWRQRVGNS
jgi:hypothetical protein